MRLIDADAMRQEWLENGENEYVYDTNAVLDSIDEQPTVYAVEVVRCKDCKHREDRIYCRLRKQPVIVTNTDFCSYGEKKEVENEQEPA